MSSSLLDQGRYRYTGELYISDSMVHSSNGSCQEILKWIGLASSKRVYGDVCVCAG